MPALYVYRSITLTQCRMARVHHYMLTYMVTTIKDTLYLVRSYVRRIYCGFVIITTLPTRWKGVHHGIYFFENIHAQIHVQLLWVTTFVYVDSSTSV